MSFDDANSPEEQDELRQLVEQERLITQEIARYLAHWQKLLLAQEPEAFFTEPGNRHVLQTTAQKLVILLTYVLHGGHPWYTGEAAIKDLVGHRSLLDFLDHIVLRHTPTCVTRIDASVPCTCPLDVEVDGIEEYAWRHMMSARRQRQLKFPWEV